MYSVYFLQSLSNGKYYVGMTEKSPVERLREHNYGTNSWTKQNGPFELVYFERYLCKEDALRREIFYKSGFGRKVRDIILRVQLSTHSSASAKGEE
ncbi:MAG: GIY-YIG nuclease family protein [Patescibacteria group bacterium]